MQTAKGTLKLNDYSDVQKTGITPAEAIVLNAMFRDVNGGLRNLEYTGDTNEDPTPMLRSKYPKDRFAKAFPGERPRLPQTFKEVGIEVKGLPIVVSRAEKG